MLHLSHLKNSLTPPPFRRSRTLKISAVGLAAVIAISLAASSVYNTSQENLKNAEAASYPDHIVNGDFEYMGGLPRLSTSFHWYYISIDNRSVLRSTDRTGRISLPASFDNTKFGWRNTTTKNTTTLKPGDVQINCGSDNNHYVDLITEEPHCCIYQDISTPNAGAVYKWSLRHASASQTAPQVNTMNVMIGAPNNLKAQEAKRTASSDGRPIGSVGKNITSGKWNSYSGVYLVPSNQPITRFTFNDIVGSTDSSGNMMDDITFTISQSLYYDCTGGSGNVPKPVASGDYPGYEQVDLPVKLTTVIPTRAGYTFIGWAETKLADATSKATYEQNKSKCVNTITMPRTAKTVYAVWAKNPTITYTDPLDNNKTIYSATVPFGSPAPALPSNITPPHHDRYDYAGHATPPAALYKNTSIPLVYTGSPVNVRFQVVNAKNNLPIKYSGLDIEMTPATSGSKISLATDENGTASMNGVALDRYTVSLLRVPPSFFIPLAPLSVDVSVSSILDDEGYLTVPIPISPQLSRRYAEAGAGNDFQFKYPA